MKNRMLEVAAGLFACSAVAAFAAVAFGAVDSTSTVSPITTIASPAKFTNPPVVAQPAKAGGPTITIVTPVNDTYVTGQGVVAQYACSATAPATVSACSGTVANGALINTTSTGSQTFTVTATDASGTTTAKVKYTVTRPTTWAGSCSAGYVALTYDDGPTPLTKAYVQKLVSTGARATFFDIGDNMEGIATTLVSDNPSINGTVIPALGSAGPADVALEANSGMAIGDHTMTHVDLTSLAQADALSEMSGQQALALQYAGYTETLIRPPYGYSNGPVFDDEQSLGLMEARWSIDTNDWTLPSVATIVSAATTGMQNGSIILMHDGYSNTLAAMPKILQYMRNHDLCPGQMVPSWTPLAASSTPWGTPNFLSVVPWSS